MVKGALKLTEHDHIHKAPCSAKQRPLPIVAAVQSNPPFNHPQITAYIYTRHALPKDAAASFKSNSPKTHKSKRLFEKLSLCLQPSKSNVTCATR